MGVAGHAHELDRLALRGLGAHHHRDVDAARIIAGSGVFLPVALPHHLEQIAVFEGLQRLDIVDLLQADDVGAGRGDRQRRQLARVVGWAMARACSSSLYSASLWISNSASVRSSLSWLR